MVVPGNGLAEGIVLKSSAINIGKVIPMNYNKYNPRCNGETEWSCGDDGAASEDGVDDDPDEARDDDDDDGDDLPSPRRNFSLPKSFFSLFGFRPRDGGAIFLRSISDAHKYRGSLKSSLGSIKIGRAHV